MHDIFRKKKAELVVKEEQHMYDVVSDRGLDSKLVVSKSTGEEEKVYSEIKTLPATAPGKEDGSKKFAMSECAAYEASKLVVEVQDTIAADYEAVSHL